MALSGSPAFECAIEVARQNGFDLSNHRAQQIGPALASSYDRILCMETWHASRVVEINPELMSRVGLLGSFHPNRQPLMQIRDPRQFEVPEMMETFAFIKTSIEGFVNQIA
jgi:protein-tyrosine phosphatase